MKAVLFVFVFIAYATVVYGGVRPWVSSYEDYDYMLESGSSKSDYIPWFKYGLPTYSSHVKNGPVKTTKAEYGFKSGHPAYDIIFKSGPLHEYMNSKKGMVKSRRP
uniref:Uncharacterized protein n=1 Tax=Steinernema glaseri TaxID=37863 RepID=A0A1I8AGD5_9BILA